MKFPPSHADFSLDFSYENEEKFSHLFKTERKKISGESRKSDRERKCRKIARVKCVSRRFDQAFCSDRDSTVNWGDFPRKLENKTIIKSWVWEILFWVAWLAVWDLVKNFVQNYFFKKWSQFWAQNNVP